MISYNFYKSQSIITKTLAIINNVEALANNDEVDSGKITCYSSFTGKGNNDANCTVKDCGSCADTRCVSYSDRGKCKP